MLNHTSHLFKVLCNSSTKSGGDCIFKTVAILEQDLDCTGVECNLENLTAFKVQQAPPLCYEYI
jgi:hypothetical protein